MRCSSRLLGATLAVCAALVAAPAAAHKSSDAYLQLEATPGGLALRVDIALRDLDVALDLDADGDGRLTWGEVKSAWRGIEAYASERIAVAGCPLVAAAGAAPALERRNDGTYAVLQRSASCAPGDEPRIRYALLGDVDPTHRGIARIRTASGSTLLRVLDPARDGAAPDTPRRPADAMAAAPAAQSPAAASGFLREGVHHIATGYDHVLFLLVLLLPAVLRRDAAGRWHPVARFGDAVWPIVGIVTSFTVAHSITLAVAALGLVALPGWFVEPAIAVTIALAAVDNVRPIFPVRRAVVAFVFGLVHGFGFAGVLAELQLPPGDFALALFLFNVGLELGQLAIVAVAVSLLYALRDWPKYGRVVVRGGSFAAIAVAAIWLVERTADVSILPL